MSATTVIRSILAANAALAARVPPTRIRLGILPQGLDLPAIGITSVSGVPRNTLSMAEPKRLVRERVQVTVFGKTYPELDQIARLIPKAVSSVRATVAGLEVQAIVPGTIGPDLEYIDPVIFTRSFDFHVSYLQ